MDDLGAFCCQNPDCPDYGLRGRGNLRVAFRYGQGKKRRLLGDGRLYTLSENMYILHSAQFARHFPVISGGAPSGHVRP
jgi:hypothetical protein